MKLFVAIIGVVGLSWLYDGLTRTEAQQFLRQMLFYFWPLIINNTKTHRVTFTAIGHNPLMSHHPFEFSVP